MPTNTQPSHCFLDFDIDNQRSKLGTAAAFVHATDTRYGFSSKDLRQLGGSETKRVEESILIDHEWSARAIETHPPKHSTRIVVKLHWDVSPITCENFSTLCKNTAKTLGQCGKPLTYVNCNIHRIIPQFIVQGGDFVFGNGSGGESIWGGKKFKDEKGGLQRRHDKRGVLSMGNSGKNSNTSQFFITFGPAPQCDGKHVVFGEVVSGFDVLDALEAVGTEDGSPRCEVRITECGAYCHPVETPSAGYWFDRPDEESYAGFTPEFVVRPRVAVLAPSSEAVRKFEASLAGCCVSELMFLKEADDVVRVLEEWKVDVILVAPACRGKMVDNLPLSWQERGLSVQDVVIIAKPIQALKAVRESWIAKKEWILDGFTA